MIVDKLRVPQLQISVFCLFPHKIRNYDRITFCYYINDYAHVSPALCIQITDIITSITDSQFHLYEDRFFMCIFVTIQLSTGMDKVIKLENVDLYNSLYGLETLHPLVSIVDLTKATKSVNHIQMNYGLYALFLKATKSCDIMIIRKALSFVLVPVRQQV